MNSMLWEGSHHDNIVQFIDILHGWTKSKAKGQFPDIQYYILNKAVLLDTYDQTRLSLDRLKSSISSPSPIKKAAHLCHYVAVKCPLRQSGEKGYSLRDEKIVNSVLAWDVASLYLSKSGFMTEGVISHDHQRPNFPSRHYGVDFIGRLANGELSSQGLCMILEALFYMANPDIPGSIDGELFDKVASVSNDPQLSNLFVQLGLMDVR